MLMMLGGNKKAEVGIVGKKFKTSEEIPIITVDWGKFFSFLFTVFCYFSDMERENAKEIC